ncbi:hypothetical protein SAMN06265219_11077 [Gracilimonas mengyeensis]|uniref:Uncharacterized protein n=2 Tax=Gracilimonas mengyeensis TaxID=1302730 RepID=A0A521E1U0_9BACT|nr:hypothetical protein SAMN06265219_11077 [Gracilimonas mengyeensis]
MIAMAFFCALLLVNVKVGVDTNADVRAEYVDFSIELAEAYAGPCGRRGCEGKTGDCGESYAVGEIGNIKLMRYCRGKKG